MNKPNSCEIADGSVLLMKNRTFVLAEMANAHGGDLDTALQICEAARDGGADAIKFQLFRPDEIAVPAFEHYSTYVELQMDDVSWKTLIEHARKCRLLVFADVFGLESATRAENYGVNGTKIHAADISNTPLLKKVGSMGKPVLLSTGGSTWIETAAALNALRSAGADQIILMHGFQSYPTKLEDSNLRRIVSLREKFNLPVGFAGHVDGGNESAEWLPVLAAAAGAVLVEVHLTVDRDARGFDYSASLNPVPFSRMVSHIRTMEASFGASNLQMTPDEKTYRNHHKKWVVTTENLEQGQVIPDHAIALKRVPDQSDDLVADMNEIVGRQTVKPIQEGQAIRRKDIQMKVAAVLACRAESQRLYGKPLQIVGDRPIIQHLIDRLNRVKGIDQIVLAISEGSSSEVFVEFARKNNLEYVIGDEKDVLHRLIQAADHVSADVVVRTTTENPYTYWENADDLIRTHLDSGADLTVTEKLPVGCLLEIISLSALKRSHREGEDRHRSELCTLFIAENPDLFNIQRISPPDGVGRPDVRLTVDTPEDLILVRLIHEALKEKGEPIGVAQIVEFLDLNPDVAAINKHHSSLYVWK